MSKAELKNSTDFTTGSPSGNDPGILTACYSSQAVTHYRTLKLNDGLRHLQKQSVIWKVLLNINNCSIFFTLLPCLPYCFLLHLQQLSTHCCCNSCISQNASPAWLIYTYCSLFCYIMEAHKRFSDFCTGICRVNCKA